MIQIKSPAEIALMRAAGLVVADALAAVRAAIRPGVTPRDLDRVAETEIRGQGAVPSFLGYHGYPSTICVSVDDVVVHGIPAAEPLRAGQIVSIDCGAILDGWHGDAAFTTTVGDGAVPEPVARLLEACEDSLWAGIAAMRPGGRLRDIGAAVEDSIRAAGKYGIVEDYGGHGIGTEMHQDPHVLNYRTRARGPRLVEGLALAIEPMLTLGSPETTVDDDGWTVRTRDGSMAAHFEHSVAITADGPWVLTAHDGGAERLAALGVTAAGLGR